MLSETSPTSSARASTPGRHLCSGWCTRCRSWRPSTSKIHYTIQCSEKIHTENSYSYT
jgi:hypothetical protein